MSLRLAPDVVDRTSAAVAVVPLAGQLANHFRQGFANKDLVPDDFLPSVREIAETVNLNKITVGEALRELELEGLIIRRKGARTRVAIPPSQRIISFARYLQTVEALARGEQPATAFIVDHGATPEDFDLLGVEILTERATAQDAEYLRIPKGTPITRRRMLECIGPEGERKPVQIHRQAFPRHITKGTPLEREVWTSGGGLLAELHSIGIQPTRFAEWWTPGRMPNRTERTLLRMGNGPVAECVRYFVIAEDPMAPDLTGQNFTPVQVSRIITPSNRIVLHAEGRLTLPPGTRGG